VVQLAVIIVSRVDTAGPWESLDFLLINLVK